MTKLANSADDMCEVITDRSLNKCVLDINITDITFSDKTENEIASLTLTATQQTSNTPITYPAITVNTANCKDVGYEIKFTLKSGETPEEFDKCNILLNFTLTDKSWEFQTPGLELTNNMPAFECIGNTNNNKTSCMKIFNINSKEEENNFTFMLKNLASGKEYQVDPRSSRSRV